MTQTLYAPMNKGEKEEELSMVVHCCNPSPLYAEAGGLSSRPAWAT
jgi:hypothetical protein